MSMRLKLNMLIYPINSVISKLILQNSAKVLKNIECDTMWLWTLEDMVGGKLINYNDIKTRFGLHTLPDLTEEKLLLYYFMFKAETFNIIKYLNQGKENAS